MFFWMKDYINVSFFLVVLFGERRFFIAIDILIRDQVLGTKANFVTIAKMTHDYL